MDRWSWTLIIIIIINLQTHHASLYLDFASLLRNRGHSENPRSRVLHLRTSGKTCERRSSTEAAARSFWRCCCCSLPLLHTSLARSSVRLDRNAVKWTRPTSNDVPFTERPETHGRRLQEVRRKYALKLMQLILSRWLRVSHTHARARTHTHLKHTYCVLPWKSCIQCTVTQLTQENRVGELIVKVNM